MRHTNHVAYELTYKIVNNNIDILKQVWKLVFPDYIRHFQKKFAIYWLQYIH